MFDLAPQETPARTFVIALEQLTALIAWLEAEGFRPAGPLNDDELGRMLLDGEVVVLLRDGHIRTAGEGAARAASRLLMVCREKDRHRSRLISGDVAPTWVAS